MNLSGQNNSSRPSLGIIGGTGMETFSDIKEIKRVRPMTKYGLPSDDILICEHGGRNVAFLPRHGIHHDIPPHKVPYKANLAALKEVGVEYVVSTCIVGSLKREIKPGAFVLLDQFINFTWGRDDTFEQDKGFIHLPMGEPYCSHVRQKILSFAESTKIEIRPTGTAVVIQGPRFSTAAESRWYSGNGWDVVNMTQYPECYFAKELGLCYAAIASVTDFDVGLHESLTIDPRYAERFLAVFRENIRQTKQLLQAFIASPFSELTCKCAATVVKAYYETT